MNCVDPITLKNGNVVPCGKCELCRSDNRNEWSIRLAIHLAQCERMPMFITLTYDDKNLHYDVGMPTLYRPDVSRFLKAYKRKHGLDNEKFQYFGCGEYGTQGRPHYHLLFFGDDELYEAFFRDTELAQARISDLWPYGFVHVCLAGFDGIHYVTKYVLKDDDNKLEPCQIKPFTIASNGLGMNFLKTDTAQRYRKQLEWLHYNIDKVIDGIPYIWNDGSNLDDVIRYLERYIPNFKVILDDGRLVFLPRAIRRKLIGSFEHFKDSPLWFYNYLKTLNESIKYYSAYSAYDDSHSRSMSYSKCLLRLEKIRKRLIEKKYNAKLKNL